MTSDEYRACVRAFGLTPVKPSYEGSTLHVDRDGQHTLVPDPEALTEEERASMIELVKLRLGIQTN